MASNIFSQVKTDLQSCTYFSMQLDDSTDMVDKAQLGIFVRMVFNNFDIKELLKMLTLEGHTRGSDIYDSIKNFFNENNIPLNKFVSIINDGAPALTGTNNGFIGLCKKR